MCTELMQFSKLKRFNDVNYSLKSYLWRNHVTQKDIALKCGVSMRTIGRRLAIELSAEEVEEIKELAQAIINERKEGY